MRTNVFLNLEGNRRPIGVLSSDGNGIAFEYAHEFVIDCFELSPITVPLQGETWRGRPDLFDGLPGFFADSLPDGWGSLLQHRQLQRKGQRLTDIDPLQRLQWIGNQGMGALEYEPEESSPETDFSKDIQLDELASDSEAILNNKDVGLTLDTLATLNGSSGGAQPKIVCLVSRDFKKLSRGSLFTANVSPWIIKFRSPNAPSDIGSLEYAVSLLAKRAGIDMPETHLFDSDKCSGWFGVQRFDRTAKGKVHMVSAAGLLHCDFRLPCLDYESLIALTLRLAGASELPQMLKRAYFNFVIGNKDDHAKNFSFVMDGLGQWHLSPAYDLLPSGGFEHTTSILGIGRNPTRDHFKRLGEKFDMRPADVETILTEVDEALIGWTKLAREWGVRRPPEFLPIK